MIWPAPRKNVVILSNLVRHLEPFLFWFLGLSDLSHNDEIHLIRLIVFPFTIHHTFHGTYITSLELAM